MYAALSNNLELVRLLARHGADIDWRKGDNQLSMLHLVARGDIPCVIVWLLEKGIDIEIRDK